MIKVFWYPRTRAGRVLWMLEEAGLEYDLVHVDVRDPAMKDSAAGFREASPMGKIPALADGQVRMADSAAICLYLADRYSAGTLAPALDDPARGRFLYWMFFSPGVMEPAMGEKMGGGHENRQAHGHGSFDAMMEVLEATLGDNRPWITGDAFTAADVMVGSTAHFLRLFNILPDSPTVSGYIDRCLSRPAYQKAMAREG